MAEDNSRVLADELSNAGFGPQYKEMIRRLHIPQKDENLASIDLVERKEVHFIFPVRIIDFTYGGNQGRFVLFEKNGKTVIAINGIVGMNVFERLFQKIVAIFKR